MGSATAFMSVLHPRPEKLPMKLPSTFFIKPLPNAIIFRVFDIVSRLLEGYFLSLCLLSFPRPPRRVRSARNPNRGESSLARPKTGVSDYVARPQRLAPGQHSATR
jgi:hypothetical protein